MHFDFDLIFCVLSVFILYTACSPYNKKVNTDNLKVSGLRCEYLNNPLSVNVEKPRLSWVIKSGNRGMLQAAYQIIVSDNLLELKNNNGNLWDSGRVESGSSIQIEYAGKKQKSDSRYFWKVRIWDDNGNVSDYSESAFWGSGIITGSDWQGDWIGKKENVVKDPGPSPYLRKEFSVNKPVKRAIVYSTARGVYELYLNGNRMGENIFSPEWTDYNKRIYYQTYDVTEMLIDGENCIGGILGDGWYSGRIGFKKVRNNYGDQKSLLLLMSLEYEDGRKEIVLSDKSWKSSYGPILNSDMLLGENYDAQKELPGWNKAGFDDSSWNQADIMEKSNAVIQAQPCQPVKITEYIKPVNVSEPQKGIYVFDLGQNIAGFVRFKVKGIAGTKITIRHSEVLEKDKMIYTLNLRAAAATDTYILSGKGEEIFQPRFTFHGFRYVEVTGLPHKPGLETVTGCAINQALPVTGTFECSNSIVNKLTDNIMWSQRGNFISVPTDCPQRDERLGWTGDAQIFVGTAAYNMDIAAFFTKWMQDVEDAQSEEGAFKDTCPYIDGMGTDGAPAWGDAGVIIPWHLYLSYGDKRVLEKHYSAMEKWMDYIAGANPDMIRENRLNNNYGDWLNVQDRTLKILLATAYWAYDAELMSKISGITGREENKRKYSMLFDKIKAAFNEKFVKPDGRIMQNTQTSYLLALYMDLLPEDKRESALQHLIGNIEKRGRHLTTGFVGVRHLNLVLSEMGKTGLAYHILQNTSYPSWGYTIKNGATSIWERWDGWTEEKGFQNPGMNSFNHYSMGSVGEWLFRFAAGIDYNPNNPGYKNIIIHPNPGGGMSFVKAEYNSIYGRIKSSWKLDGRIINLKIDIPANTTADIYLPVTDPSSATEGGIPAAKSEGVKYLRYEKGCAVYNAGSGEYEFSGLYNVSQNLVFNKSHNRIADF